eukprot:12520406-Heterocapsa_arctica.AAC.1
MPIPVPIPIPIHIPVPVPILGGITCTTLLVYRGRHCVTRCPGIRNWLNLGLSRSDFVLNHQRFARSSMAITRMLGF